VTAEREKTNRHQGHRQQRWRLKSRNASSSREEKVGMPATAEKHVTEQTPSQQKEHTISRDAIKNRYVRISMKAYSSRKDSNNRKVTPAEDLATARLTTTGRPVTEEPTVETAKTSIPADTEVTANANANGNANSAAGATSETAR
jgi:hypothetical protein